MVPGPQSLATSERIFVDPRYVLFRLGQDEATLDELARLQIELAQSLGVFTPGGEPNQA